MVTKRKKKVEVIPQMSKKESLEYLRTNLNGQASDPRMSAALESLAKSANGEKKDRDEYGSMLGSQAAKINAILSEVPQSAVQLKKAAGVKYDPTFHLDMMFRISQRDPTCNYPFCVEYVEGQGYFLKPWPKKK